MKLRQRSAHWAFTLGLLISAASPCLAAGGSLTLHLEDESSGQNVISRVEFYRGVAPSGRSEKPLPVRQTVSAGIGVVVDRSVVLELPDGPYRFRIIRGPEYRVINGTFELEKTSLDEKTVALPRMVDMAAEGWLAGDCCVTPSSESVPLRMASEDLHVAAVLGKRPAKPIPHRDADDPIGHDPLWVRTDVTCDRGLAYFGLDEQAAETFSSTENSLKHLVAVINSETETDVKIGIENPFAWELPVWLASGKVQGIFVMGDWLRLDKRVLAIRDGHAPSSFSLGEPTQVGRYAERIYRHVLDAGIPLVPLAGGGDASARTPIGYNRLYVTSDTSSVGDDVSSPTQPASEQAWWEGVWAGNSVATNGPLLRPLVGGKLPGHVFQGHSGEVLRLQPELNLAVRDPVDYLEVIHNNRVHYSARLDEFAKAGGEIPPIMAEESGWVILRVMTLHDDHYRAAVSAPWWIEFDGRRRVSQESVRFFQDWLSQYEQRLTRLPPEEIAGYVPFIRAAREFWENR
ncbi:hypothetical protein Mal15_41380 [Stieleria maiorica]|uniref:Uncharacterized protein n=1 Tax=Stieleria maiorica TaxID=2795974 RepID=A0A5B9MHU0_9BACT|nr:hypothetical protein [Stieleria maiorica]QEG00070.1 hypothetical protein Mal15_41380 [Stieleria maiorica]